MERSGHSIRSAFVTGATGLLGSSLVRQLAGEGIAVKALVRSPAKAAAQFRGLAVELVLGDVGDVPAFQPGQVEGARGGHRQHPALGRAFLLR